MSPPTSSGASVRGFSGVNVGKYGEYSAGEPELSGTCGSSCQSLNAQPSTMPAAGAMNWSPLRTTVSAVRYGGALTWAALSARMLNPSSTSSRFALLAAAIASESGPASASSVPLTASAPTLSHTEPKLALVWVELRNALSGVTSMPSNCSRAPPTTLVGSRVGAGTPTAGVTSSHAASVLAVIWVWPLNSETEPGDAHEVADGDAGVRVRGEHEEAVGGARREVGARRAGGLHVEAAEPAARGVAVVGGDDRFDRDDRARDGRGCPGALHVGDGVGDVGGRGRCGAERAEDEREGRGGGSASDEPRARSGRAHGRTPEMTRGQNRRWSSG